MASEKKIVLITGGNRGLGKALVDCFVAAGWMVWTTARRLDSLPKDNLNIVGFELDLASRESVVNLSNQIIAKNKDESSTISMIVHNAGFNPKDNKSVPGYFESTFYAAQFSAANVAESNLINALHPMELTGRIMPVLSQDCIVLAISSWLGSIGEKTVPGHYGYSGSKALMNMCIKGLSLEFAKASDNRVAIALNPGWMKTDMGGSRADIAPEEVAEQIRSMAEDGFFHANNGKFLNTDRSEHAW